MLYLSFLWHMHQPWYVDPARDRFVLPWVRLHGLKDYLDMALLVSEFPTLRAVFNLSPSLLMQLELYAQGVPDELLQLCEIPSDQLTPHQSARLLEIGFAGAPDRMIRPYPRYSSLYLKADKREPFSPQDLRDLAVWSSLAWIDPRWRKEDPFFQRLLSKGSSFSEEEKAVLHEGQRALLAKIIPTYRSLQDRGRVELTTNPWSHPILPLLARFGFSDDVAWHLEESRCQHERFFGRAPLGLWPSEGAVSAEILGAVEAAGFQWLATDEEILWKSLKNPSSRNRLYRPYALKTERAASLSILFRDHVLSDRIGFVYQGWDSKEAANDLIKRLMEIEKSSASSREDPFVLIALDGENPWEFYPEDGEPFLRALYEGLARNPDVRCVTISEYLQEHPAREHLGTLASGSWIRADFSTWAGHSAHDRAWHELQAARRWRSPRESRSMAIAQGSDWFWWLGPEHNSSQDPVFDELFRSHLKAVYEQAAQTPPPSLEMPIKKGFEPSVLTAPTGFVAPRVDGEVTTYFEWLCAGELSLEAGGAMARSQPQWKRFFWGSDGQRIFFRLDPAVSPELLKKGRWGVLIEGKRFCVALQLHEGLLQGIWFQVESGRRQVQGVGVRCAFSKIIEMELPLQQLGLLGCDALEVVISITEEGGTSERYPITGFFQLPLPTETLEGGLWRA